MAVNCSHLPLIPVYRPEEIIVQGGSQDSDIVERLPADPFGMDTVTAAAAFTGWLEDFGAADCGGGYRGGYGGGYGGGDYGFNYDYSLFAGMFLLNKASMELGAWNNKIDDTMLMRSCCFDDFFAANVGGCLDGFLLEEKFGGCNVMNVVDDGAPHPALSFALAYLGVRDLLSVERVCKSLRVTVQTDSLLWRSIHIHKPFSEKINDDVLLKLTNRAQGHLQCLSLVECNKITDDGLKRVLDSNKELTKLSVPGCTKLSIDGVVNCLRSFNHAAAIGIKYLRVGGLFGVTSKHFEELMSLLGIHNQVPANLYKPHFYHRGNLYLSYEDDRPIDIEMCPRCQNLRLVYDCPVEGCQGENQAAQLCRACTLCIYRCVQCGKCINDDAYEETFCLEKVCSVCYKPVGARQERRDVGGSHSRDAVPQEPVISFHG